MNCIYGRSRVLATLLLLAGAVSSAFAGGSPASAEGAESAQLEPRPVTVTLASGATALAVARMATAGDFDEAYPVTWDILSSADAIAARLISGEADIALVPTNLAASLYNGGRDVKVLGAAVWGLLYIVGNDGLQSVADLRGKTVDLWGRGLTPDIVLRHLLRESGLDPDRDVELRYRASATELAPLFLTGRADLVLVPEPMVSTILSRNTGARVALDLQREWGRVTNGYSSFPQAVLVGQGRFLREHSDFVARFVENFAGSIDWVTGNPAEAGILAAQLMPESNAQVLAASVPRLSLRFVPALEARAAIEAYLQVLIAADPKSAGGGLPGASFYFER